MAGSFVPKVSRGAMAPPDPLKGFSGTYSLTLDDHIGVDLGKDASVNYLPWFYSAAALVMFGSLIATYPSWRAGDMTRFFAINALVLAVLLALRWVLNNWLTHALRHRLDKRLRDRGHIGREVEVDIGPAGITMRLLGTTTTTPWRALTTIEEMDDGPVYFWLTEQDVCLWPERLFESHSHRLQLRQAIADWAGYRAVRPPLLARLTAGERREVANGKMNIGGFVNRRKDNQIKSGRPAPAIRNQDQEEE